MPTLIFWLSLSQVAPEAHAQAPMPATLQPSSQKSTALDLWRPWEDADKIYVMAGLPDGSSALFLVDTGASISVLNTEVAQRLGLKGEDTGGLIQGLSGSVPWMRSSIATLTLGDFTLEGVDVAIGVPGVPEHAGVLPVGGILGTNVWSRFTCVVDYPADLLELHRPRTYHVPRRAAPMIYDGYRAVAEIGVRASLNGQQTEANVLLQVDTGAHDLLFSGRTGEPFRSVSTVGVEPVVGVGADLDRLPESELLHLTRRVPVQAVRIGDRWIEETQQAQWVGADSGPVGPTGLLGLLGYEPLSDFRVVLDFPGQRLHLEPSSRHPARDFDAPAAYLAQERRLHGEDPARAIIRARLQAGSGDLTGARATLDAALAVRPDDVELRVLSARIHRSLGAWEPMLADLLPLPVAGLVEQGEWISLINSLALLGRAPEALQRAQAALSASPADTAPADNAVPAVDRAELYVALSDALLQNHRLPEAARAIDDGADLHRGFSAHLLRKARIASLEGDRYGSITVLRHIMQIFPISGVPIWLYGLQLTPLDRSTFHRDIDRTLARLHPGDEPWDFAGAGWMAAGDTARAHDALSRGQSRDCVPLKTEQARANCDAWYLALGNEKPDEAVRLIESALAADPFNSAYIDTAATVYWMRGERDKAREQARRAALLSPDDPYLLWQLSRMESP